MKASGNVCVVIAKSTLAQALKAARCSDLAEVRIDLCEFTDDELARLFRTCGNLIATCRTDGLSEAEAERRLEIAIHSGARFLDLDISTSQAMRKRLISLARRKHCTVIVSYHNFKKTPSRTMLEKIIAKAKACGAAIVKIACVMNAETDGARLLGLLDHGARDSRLRQGSGGLAVPRPLIITGMGKRSAVTRVAAPLLGSFATYVSLKRGKESAPGQLTLAEMKKIMNLLSEPR